MGTVEDEGPAPSEGGDKGDAEIPQSTDTNEEKEKLGPQAQPEESEPESFKPNGCTSSADGVSADLDILSIEQDILGSGEMASLLNLTHWREEWNPRMSMSFTSTKGLLNAPGENNCFLNSAVQVLWHLDVFRRSFRTLSGHACMGNSCIFCALKVIFTQFQYSDQTALPPDALRKALAKTFVDQQRFQLGHMDDAAECFENILTRIHFHIAHEESEDMCNAKHCIPHQKFAMTVVEQVVCRCGATSEPHPFTQMVYYVSTSALSHHYQQTERDRGRYYPALDFSQLLKEAVSDGDIRPCPSDCGEKVKIRRNLMNRPDVVSVGLVWDSDRPTQEHIRDVLRSIGLKLELHKLFHSVVDLVAAQKHALELVGLVCYYGKHYSTFYFHSKRCTWIYFDDANVKEIGDRWESVVDKCCRGHFQPLLLMYANPDSTPVAVETAPQYTFILETSPDVNAGRHQQRVDSRAPDRASEVAGPPSYPKCNNQGRAQTPNPSMYDGAAPCESRRSQTPTPGWGGYHSEEEEDKKDCIHVRQSSFLTAMDMTDSRQHDHSRQPNYLSHTIRQGELLDLNAQVPPPQFQPHYYGTPTYPPPPTEPQPAYTQAGQTGHHHQGAPIEDGQHSQGMNSNSSAPNGTEYGDWTLSSSNPYRRQVSVPPNIEPPSLNGWQMVSPPPDAPPSPGDFKKGKGQVRTDVVRYQQRGHGMNGPYQQLDQQGDSRQLSYSQHMNNPVPDSLKTPGLRRSQSLESTQLSMAGQGLDDWEYVQPLQNNTTKHRPSSVTPFDYGNQKPQVTQRHQHQGCRDADSIDGMSSDSASLSSQDMMEKSDYDMYINRKAVESILNHQHKLARQMSNCSTKSTGSNSSTESGKALSHKQKKLLKDALKADITDNSSVSSQNSHRDSGYRSSESSGDRTSNSSAGSGSTESQAGDGMTSGYPRPEQIKMLFGVQSWDQRAPGSASGAHNTASMSSRGSHKLAQIPETLPAGHRGPVYKETVSEKPTILLKPSVAPDVPPSENSIHADGPDKTCAALFQAAEELMLQCKQQEEKQDNASALCLCNKALNYYQQALNIHSTSQKTYIFARMRHNACVMKSRSLHRNMMTRQDSCQSNMSSDTNDDGQMSTSSKGTDSGRGSEKDFMTQQDIMSVYQSQSYAPVAPASVKSYSSSSSSGSSSSKDNVKHRGTKQQKSAGGACARKLRKHSGNNGMQSAHSATDIRNIHQTPEISEKYDPGNLVVHYATLPRKQKQKAAKMVSGGGSVTTSEVKTYHKTRPKSPVADKPSSRSHKDRHSKNEASSSGVSSASSSSSISHSLGQSDIRSVLYPEISNKPANHAPSQRADSVTSQVSSLSQHVTKISLSQSSRAEHSYLGPQPTDRKEPHYHCPYEMGLRKQQPPQPPQLPAQQLTSASYQPPSGNTDSSYACHNPIYDYLPWQTKQGQGNHSRQNSSDSNRTLTPCFGEHSRQTSTASSTTVTGDTEHSRENSLVSDSRQFEEESVSNGVSNGVRSAPTSPHPGRRVIGPPRPGNRQSSGPVRPSLVKGLDRLQQHQMEMFSSQDQAALQHALQPAPRKGILKNANSHKGEDPGVMTQGIAQGGSGDHDHHNHVTSHDGYGEMTTEDITHTNPAVQPYSSSTTQHHSNPAHTDRHVSNPATPNTANKNHSRVTQVAAMFDQRFQTAGTQSDDKRSCSSHTAHTKNILETGVSEQQCGPACADQDDWADSELPRHFRPRTASDPTGCGRKPALVKKRAKHRQPKNVTFCENIALISTAEDTPEDPSFVRMIQNSLLTQSLPCNNNRPLPSKNSTSDPSGRTSSSLSQGRGYDSDGDEEESLEDSPSSPEEDFTDSSKVRCSLCRKHSVCADQVYCTDCNAYMSRFQPKVQ